MENGANRIKMLKLRSFISVFVQNLVFLVLLLAIGFLLPRLIPGSPINTASDSMYVLNSSIPEEAYNRFKEYYAPDEPVAAQLVVYAKHILKLDLGYSFHYGIPVIEMIKGRLGWTLLISTAAILASCCTAVPLGIFSGMRKGKSADFVITMLFIAVEAIPVFLIALLLQFKLGYDLKIFPAQGAYSIGMKAGDTGYIRDVALHAAVPVMAAAIAIVPSMLLLTRNIVARAAREPFVEMAYYNNVKHSTIVFEYLLRSSLPELLSKLNIHFIYAVAGVMYVEMIFSYPGMGLLLKNAVSSRDYCLIQGIFLVIGVFGIMVNAVFGWISGILFPRYDI